MYRARGYQEVSSETTGQNALPAASNYFQMVLIHTILVPYHFKTAPAPRLLIDCMIEVMIEPASDPTTMKEIFFEAEQEGPRNSG